MQHDRPGDQLGEEGDEQRIIQNIVARNGALVAVDDVGKLLEGKKRNAQRQRQMVERQMQAERAVQVFKEEIVVFEVKQHAEVQKKSQQHQRQAHGLLFLREHQLAERVIDEDAACNDRHIAGIVVAVEKERGQYQKHLVELVFFRQSAQQKIAQQGQRQKRQHENVGIEQHVGMCSFSKNQNGQSPASAICAANARMTSLFASSCAASVTRESPAAISSAIASLISGP